MCQTIYIRCSQTPYSAAMTDAHWALQAIGWVIAAALTLAGALAVLTVLGMAIEGIGRHQEDRERCLKQATNGYEIERCR